MSTPRLRALAIEGFRGIKGQRELEFDGRSIVLVGPNGSGKSSFVEALEYALSGRVDSLDGRGAGISAARHGPHIRGTGWRIELAFTGGLPPVVVTGTGTNGVLPGDYRDGGREQSYVLRRRQLLDFVEALPRSRYDVLRPFLPVQRTERLEATLEQVVRTLDSEYRDARRRADGARASLRDSLAAPDGERPNDDDESVFAAINARLESAGRSPVGSVDELSAEIDALTAELGDPQAITAETRIILDMERAIGEFERFDPELIERQVEQVRVLEADRAGHFHDAVLQQGAVWIEEDALEDCPLCEQRMELYPPDEVVARARAKVEARHELVEARRTLVEAVQAARASLRIAVESTLAARHAPGHAENEDTTESWAADAVDVRESVLRLEGDVGAQAATLVAARNPILTILTNLRASLAERLAVVALEPQGRLVELRSFCQAASNALALVRSSGVSAEATHRALDRAEVTRGAVIAARKAVVGRVLTDVSRDIDKLYQQMHASDTPEGCHTNVGLELRDAVNQSVQIKADFYEKAHEDPRAYFSEAHLDTLGFSVFLALRRWHRRRFPEFPLLVIDDAVTSVDASHVADLARVLLTEFSDYQMLVTTHDQIFFQQLRDMQSRGRVSASYSNRQILAWSIDDGPDVHEPMEQSVHLESLLPAGEAHVIAVAAGRLLENVLQEMRYSLPLAVHARRDERYDIGALWPPFYKSMLKDFKGFSSAMSQCLTRLDTQWPLRNWQGAHFNNWALNIPRSSSVAFASAVIELFKATYCRDCRRYLEPSIPRGMLACRGSHLVYMPSAPVTSETTIAPIGSLRTSKLGIADHIKSLARTEAS